jgi:2-amino-4-hydroxy-6-hydroxymethyldihydropteridine diphosphokinase
MSPLSEPRGTLVFLGLGSNLGDRPARLHEALERLGSGIVTVRRRSALYRTEPVEVTDQDEFLNQVVAAETELDPAALVRSCLEVERQMGRVRTRDKGPRAIDLDLLLHGDTVLHQEGVEVPHPRLHLRRFVLVPLVEIAPDVSHPVFQMTAKQLLDRCPDHSRVRRLEAF